MTIPPGTYHLGPDDGRLTVWTRRTGAAAKAGHNLVIDVGSWEATLRVGEDPADTRVEITADASSLTVREGRGGVQELGDDDKAGIEQTIHDEILKRTKITFTSTSAARSADGSGVTLKGDLSLMGQTRPLEFDAGIAADGRLTAVAKIVQSNWGMKPYTTLFGALKVVDEVTVTVGVHLPASVAPESQPTQSL